MKLRPDFIAGPQALIFLFFLSSEQILDMEFSDLYSDPLYIKYYTFLTRLGTHKISHACLHNLQTLWLVRKPRIPNLGHATLQYTYNFSASRHHIQTLYKEYIYVQGRYQHREQDQKMHS